MSRAVGASVHLTSIGMYASDRSTTQSTSGPSGSRQKLTLVSLQETLEAPEKCTYILVKTRSDVDPVSVAQRIDQELPGNNVQFTKDVFASVESSIPSLGVFLRILVALAAVVSALVVMLAMHTTITERTREIGVRVALGAARGDVLRLVIGQAMRLSTLGAAIGLLLAAGATQLLVSFLYGVRPLDPVSFGAGAAIFCALALAASWLPARRAASVNPVDALRTE